MRTWGVVGHYWRENEDGVNQGSFEFTWIPNRASNKPQEDLKTTAEYLNSTCFNIKVIAKMSAAYILKIWSIFCVVKNGKVLTGAKSKIFFFYQQHKMTNTLFWSKKLISRLPQSPFLIFSPHILSCSVTTAKTHCSQARKVKLQQCWYYCM